jgi:hypothetical protein
MPGPKPNAGRLGPSARESASELLRLVVAYAKQETVEPVVGQLKWLLKGLAGASLLTLGTVLLGIGFVRALQAEFGAHLAGAAGGPNPYGGGGHLTGDWSWVPYLGGALFCLLVAVFCVLRIVRGARR